MKRSEFRKVYDEGSRLSATSFLAFYWNSQSPTGPRFGLTAPKSLGKAVTRNRMKRRVREQVRLNLWQFPPEWWVVLNLKRAALNATPAAIASDLRRVLTQCGKAL